ncbi:hypothetical protein FVEN_g5992 [Fusarium venenatum]|uniref:DUF1680 domain protein n=1 Tax=Fusarium venenatum TaxID=56646 RepID=A0A2L2TE55_9HYPO|nr:uncharacterized protein FVRRES_05722 [Fusarium venenatum]KAG8356175.1 hypothetical protein FVEN_g5992 [Fusarium venenatum]KAH6992774.1 hypothetical protein EDB82DRAFT_428478 [Fusarium venenatum]CEI61286.1 unnamed protein product [Fusarium venenatum]
MSHPQSTFRHTTFAPGSILHRRRTTIAKTTLHTQLKRLRETGRYDCFKLKWHDIYGDKSMWPVPFHLFWDSDIAKWIEGACYFLHDEFDPEIDTAVKELVETIRGAQQDDGYLNVHYTVVEPGKRWTNLQDMHELYNAGHLIEAAIAHHHYYKNNLLLEPIEKYVALIHRTFGSADNQLHGYPGHPEIELALFRLYQATGNQTAYDLSRYFIEERGNKTGQAGEHYFEWESKQRGQNIYQRPDSYPEHASHWYCQAHKPILEQDTVEGHSVRAMYLLTAVADMVCIDNQSLQASSDWKNTLNRLWNNMVEKKMYLTGGIGAIKQWEGFGRDYFLPQSTDEGGCYAETCASIAVMMLAERLLHIDLDGRFGDVMELCLYNNVMTSMSLDGKAFTYVNQLGSSESDKSVREEWFWCACCPPNVTRLYGSLGGYLWDFGNISEGEVYINVHLYSKASLKFEVAGQEVLLEQDSDWPWDGLVKFRLSAPESLKTTIRLRIPGWSRSQYQVTPEPSQGSVNLHKGYLTLNSAYVAKYPEFSLSIGNFKPLYLAPHPYTNQRTLTLTRGPLVYCMEDADNNWEDNHFKDIGLKASTLVDEERKKFGDEEYVELKTSCWRRTLNDAEAGTAPGPGSVVDCEENAGTKMEAIFVPYYLRANRGGNGHMRVGLNRI